MLEDWDKSKPYFMDDYWEPLQVHRSCDVRFCHEAAKLGHYTYLDCAMVLPHVGIQEVTDTTYWEALEKKAKELGIAA